MTTRRGLFAVAAALLAAAALVAVVVMAAADDDDGVAGGDPTTVPEATSSTRAPGMTTSTGGRSGGPAVAALDADGRLLVLDAASGEVRRVAADGIRTDDPAKNDLAVSPGGDTAFVVLPDSPDRGTHSIARVRLAGGDAEVVAEGLAPSVSPDGSTLAYVAFEGAEPPSPVLVLRDLASGEERRLRREAARDFAFVPDTAWSLDGSTILFVAGEIRTGLYAVDAAASSLDDARRLGPDAAGGPEEASWRSVAAFGDGRLAVVETCCDLPERERWHVLDVALAGGGATGPLLPGDRVEATALDAPARGGALVYVTGGGPSGGTLWRWDGAGPPVEVATRILTAAW